MRELIRELTHVHLRRTYDARLCTAEQNQTVVFVCVVARGIYSARARLPTTSAVLPHHRTILPAMCSSVGRAVRPVRTYELRVRSGRRRGLG
jgi:hypothetical protein